MMRVLGIELSSPMGSVALVEDGSVVREMAWADAPRDSRRAFDALERILKESGISAAEIDLFAAGRGPGNYSGMRIALTVAAGLAMPGGRLVHSVDSGAALADAVLQEVAADDVLIAGDARRGRVWHAAFHRAHDGSAVAVAPWALCETADLSGIVPPAGIGATPDWERLSAAASLPGPSGAWLQRAIFPSASFVALRALRRQDRGEPSEPAAPIYLHPAVALPPSAAPAPEGPPRRPAVFFDRDGIVNESPGPGYVERWEDFHLLPAFVEALRVVVERGYEPVVVTNQRGVGRGIVTQEALDRIHHGLVAALASHGLRLRDILVCTAVDNADPRRKPNPGMLVEAAAKHGLDLARSWMIGDSEKDIEAGRRAGCAVTVRVHPSPGDMAASARLPAMSDLPAYLRARLPPSGG